MNLTRCVSLALVLTGSLAVPGAEGQAPPMLLASFSNKAAYIVDGKGEVVWECKVPGSCQEAWLLADGNVLLAGGNKVKVVRPDKSVVWEYTSPAGSPIENHTCQPLPDGKTLMGEGGTKRILELDATGKIVKELKLDLPGDAHGQFRQLRKTPTGGYLFCNLASSTVREIDADGKAIRTISAADMGKQNVKWGALHSVELLATGNLLIGGGYGSPVVELDPQGKVVWKLSAQDVPDLKFTYAAGCLRLANGNTVVAGYNSEPKVFEVTPEKKVVWKFQNPAVGNPTHVKILKPEDVERFRAAPK
jgi:hypothetical protein